MRTTKKIFAITILFIGLAVVPVSVLLFHNQYTSNVIYKLNDQIDGEIVAIHFLDKATGYVFSGCYTKEHEYPCGLNVYKTTTGGEFWELIYYIDNGIVVSAPIGHHDSRLIDSVVYMPARESLDTPFKEIQYDTRLDTLIWTDKKTEIEFFCENPSADSILTRYNEYRFVSDIVRTDSIMVAIVGNYGGLGTVKDIVFSCDGKWHKIRREAYFGLGPMCVAEKFLYVIEDKKLLIYNLLTD